MWSNLPLFPARASTMAGHVDALYFFLVAIAAFFTCLISALILFFAIRYRKERNPQATQIHGSTALELFWTGIPLAIVMVIFVWSSVIFFMQTRPPKGSMEIYCRRQAVDVEVPAHRGAAGDQRTARSGGPRRAHDHDLAGRDS